MVFKMGTTVRSKKFFSYTHIKQTKGINLPTNLTAKLLIISRHCSKCYVKVIKSEQCSTTSQFNPRSPVALQVQRRNTESLSSSSSVGAKVAPEFFDRRV